MIQELSHPERRIVGAKQVIRAIDEGRVSAAYVAKDADLTLTQRVVDRCYARQIPCQEIETMEALGRACGIQVPASAAALLRQNA